MVAIISVLVDRGMEQILTSTKLRLFKLYLFRISTYNVTGIDEEKKVSIFGNILIFGDNRNRKLQDIFLREITVIRTVLYLILVGVWRSILN
jgi:hypothetical protein